MDAIIVKIGDKKESRFGGTYIRVLFKSLQNNLYYTLDVYDKHKASIRFMPYLVEQNILGNLNILNEKKRIINGNSDFTLIRGIKKISDK